MKTKHIFSCIILLTLFSTGYAQKKSNNIYEVSFFKWSNYDSIQTKKIVRIDSSGKIFFQRQQTLQKVAIQSFSKALNTFIQLEQVEKIAPSNNPPDGVLAPNVNEQKIYISITFLKDYQNDKAFRSKTYYFWSGSWLDKNFNNYVIYKYLNKNDGQMLKKLLD